MSEAVTQTPPLLRMPAAASPKTTRKTQPVMFPHRLTVCLANDQIVNLQKLKRALRSTESFVIRAALDAFSRANGFPVNADGGPHD